PSRPRSTRLTYSTDLSPPSVLIPVPILSTTLLLFSLSCYADHRDLHSFPTRRSSDLGSQTKGRAPPGSRAGGEKKRKPQKLKSEDRKSTRLNSSHVSISYAVFCLKKKKLNERDIVVNKGASERVNENTETARGMDHAM